MLKKLAALRERFLVKPEPVLATLALLLIRLSVGVVFAQTGWGKLHHLDDIIEFFRSLGIPAPELQAPFVSTLEFVGGIAVILGLGTRLFSAPLMFSMVVAIITAKKDDIESLTDVLGFIEWHYIVFFAVLVLLGPGKVSLDALIAKKLSSGGASTPTPAPAAAAAPAPAK
jgi:putative oxidoreductase